jgi:hypothetical protein
MVIAQYPEFSEIALEQRPELDSRFRELPDKYELINREQNLGDPGLRQAKESYKPIGFVEKYRAAK